MRIHRLYCPDLHAAADTLSLGKDASHYLLQVLRCKVGQTLEVFNGSGLQCSARLEHTERRSAIIKLHGCEQRSRESPLPLQLALGISKGERMDVAIQKAVELGVTEIQPLQTERSVVKLNTDRADKRRQHWQAIVINACEQCGRNHLPLLHPVQHYADWLAANLRGACWLFAPHSAERLVSQPRPDAGVTLLIGPEGGLSEREIDTACQRGFVALNFGPRILRTETAAIACISAVQTLWGDLG